MKLDKTKLKAVFESSGIDNGDNLVNELQTLVTESFDTQVQTLVTEAVANLKSEHTQELATLNETFIQEKQSLIESNLTAIEEQKVMGKQLIDTLVQENEDLKDSVETFESVKEQLVEFTMEELNTEYNSNLEMFFGKVAEAWVEEKDDELSELAENKAYDLGLTTIAEALSISGFNLTAEGDSVANQLSELEEDYDTLLQENTLLKTALRDIEKEVMIEEAISGLSQLESDKLRAIAENMQFKDSNSFNMALKFMQESMSSSTKKANTVTNKPVIENKFVELSSVEEDDDYGDLVSATLSVMS